MDITGVVGFVSHFPNGLEIELSWVIYWDDNLELFPCNKYSNMGTNHDLYICKSGSQARVSIHVKCVKQGNCIPGVNLKKVLRWCMPHEIN